MTDEKVGALERAARSVEGLSLGDAFGEMFFAAPGAARVEAQERELPEGRWRYTDDTVMALGIHQMLAEEGSIEGDRLAEIFAERYRDEPWRGYGPNARDILESVARGGDWRGLSRSAFQGEGSFGNGGAMRVAPVGAYFAADLASVVDAADRSARVTHAHPEGRAGAIAVAVATAVAWRTRRRDAAAVRETIFETVVDRTPDGEVRERIDRASEIDADRPTPEVAERLGSGQRVTAMDTVPFVIWCASTYLDDFVEALWQTVSGLGDRDTTCAMVGGIVSQRDLLASSPSEWSARRERLDWRLEDQEER